MHKLKTDTASDMVFDPTFFRNEKLVEVQWKFNFGLRNESINYCPKINAFWIFYRKQSKIFRRNSKMKT